jgi:hypothetical protein
MTTLAELQTELQASGRYQGTIDGLNGPATQNAILAALHDGPDTRLCQADYDASAARLFCPVAHIMAFAEVEANGAGFEDGYPKILFEPHRFHKATGGRFGLSHPRISYPKWGTLPYPSLMRDRYAQLLEAVGLDVEAGFATASYGKFQIMGENAGACGYAKAHRFAFAMAFDEKTQLLAFEEFIRKAGILPYLRLGEWAKVAKLYNGTGYARNQYDVKLARAAGRIAAALATTGRAA